MSKSIVLLLCALVLLPSVLYAQESDIEPIEDAVADSSAASDSSAESKRVQFAAIPMVNYDPSFEWNLAALANAFFKVSPADTVSPSSMAGAMVGYTTNGTWYWSLYSKLYLDEDNYRATAAYGDASVNFQYYDELMGSFIDFNSLHDVFMVELQRRVYERWYLGLRYVNLKTKTNYEIEGETGDPDKQNMNNVGLVVSHDARDHIYNPYDGDYMNLRTGHYRDAWGSDYIYDKYEFDFTKFFGISDSQVVAARCAAFVATGDVPFEGQYVVGRDDIRGYTNGMHRGEQVYDLQGEYRWNVHGKWGAVAFGGVATAVDSPDEITWSGLLPAAGVGIRYMAIPSEQINIGIDVAFGKDDWGVYFRIGEVFGDK
jgi:outer membrane protein assembly factor BamA